jgi:hypothetical protein
MTIQAMVALVVTEKAVEDRLNGVAPLTTESTTPIVDACPHKAIVQILQDAGAVWTRRA